MVQTAPVLFISDLHLDSGAPETLKLFTDFLDGRAREAGSLYILGDLFEVWLGDDDDSDFNRSVIRALRALADAGIELYFMHGNRDFLIGERFAAQAGCRLIDDPTPLTLFGRSMLLMHGDTLCTGDTQYQQYRKMVRSPAWQRQVLEKPLAQRRLLAEQIREQSMQDTQSKTYEIMDVEQQTVISTLQQYQVDYLVHGHTHRMNRHQVDYDDRQATRIVLGDWQTSPSYLLVSADEISLHRL